MTLLLQLRLRYLLLMLIGGSGLLIGALSYMTTQPLALRQVERQAEARLAADLTQLQGVLELLLRLDQNDSARRVVAAFGAKPGYESMILVGADDTIIASTAVAELGQAVSTTAHAVDTTELTQIADSGASRTVLTTDRNHLTGYVQVCGRADDGELRPRQCGFIYTRQTLIADRQDALWLLQRQLVANAVGIVLVALLLWWLLQQLLTRRARHLIDFAQQFAAGDRRVRARLTGRDELAQIGQTLDTLLDTVEAEENKLRHAQQVLQIRDRAIEASTNAVVVTDPTQRDNPIIYLNPAFEQMTGFTAAAAIGRNCRFLQSDDDRDQPGIVAMRTALAEQRPVNTVVRNYRKDGTLFWNEVFIAPVFDDTGVLTHFIGIQNDISARKATEQSLRQLSKVFMEATDPILIEDLDGRIIDLNDETEQAYGWSREALLGQSIKTLLPAEHHNDGEDLLARCKRGEPVRNVQWQRQTKDGTVVPVLLTLSLLTDEMGQAVAVAALAKDISELKQTEAALRRSQETLEQRVAQRTAALAEGNRRLAAEITEHQRTEEALRDAKATAEHANAAKSRFLAAASHDLRQPLQTMTVVQGVLTRLVKAADAQTPVRRLGDAIKSMNDMLNALLDINRLETGAISPKHRDFPIASLFARMLSDFSYSAEEKGLVLRFAPSKAVLHSDPDLLQEIVRNLIGNAIKYTEQGKILIGCRRGGDDLRIEVWDTGPGIPEQRRQAIFEEFYQLNNRARDKGHGLGLGLAIVERLTQLLDHRLDVQSRVGKGSMFAVTVPRGQTLAQTAPSAATPASSSSPSSTDGHGQSILYIEDDPAIRDSMQLLLKIEGFQVTLASDGREALAQVTEKGLRPDIILTDYRLPGGETGDEVVQRLREILVDEVPAIMITGDISSAQAQIAEQAGCQLLHKPVNSDQLLDAIHALGAA